MTNCKRTVLNVCLLQIGICAAFAPLPSSTARCQVSTSPVQVRAEGLTERLGDIVLQCSGSVPGAVFTGNFTLYLPVSVTNRVDANNQTRDAVVSVDLGSGFVPTAIAGQVSGNSISFNGISYTAPASGNVNLRISNVRAAMNQLGYTSAVPAQITASLVSSLGAVRRSRLASCQARRGPGHSCFPRPRGPVCSPACPAPESPVTDRPSRTLSIFPTSSPRERPWLPLGSRKASPPPSKPAPRDSIPVRDSWSTTAASLLPRTSIPRTPWPVRPRSNPPRAAI